LSTFWTGSTSLLGLQHLVPTETIPLPDFQCSGPNDDRGREADEVVDAVDGTATQARIDELKRQLAEQQAENQALHERLKHAVEITPDTQDEFATVAQAEGVSLSVARRLLRVVAGSRTIPSVPTLGRATLDAGQRAGALLGVLDEAARPKVEQGTADEIFLAANRS
jgi:hypothetical protein